MRREIKEEDGDLVIYDFMEEVDETMLNRYKRHPQEWLSVDLPYEQSKESVSTGKQGVMHFVQNIVLALRSFFRRK